MNTIIAPKNTAALSAHFVKNCTQRLRSGWSNGARHSEPRIVSARDNLTNEHRLCGWCFRVSSHPEPHIPLPGTTSRMNINMWMEYIYAWLCKALVITTSKGTLSTHNMHASSETFPKQCMHEQHTNIWPIHKMYACIFMYIYTCLCVYTYICICMYTHVNAPKTYTCIAFELLHSLFIWYLWTLNNNLI